MSSGNVQVAMIVLAAGQSSRMAGIDKVLLPIGGKPVLWHSLQVLDAHDAVGAVVIVTADSRVAEISQSIAHGGFSKIADVVAGGDRRQDSVWNGIAALRGDDDASPFIAVHDAARPFIDAGMLTRGIECAARIGAAVPVMPLKDTVKRVAFGLVTETLPREELFAVQTPQVFRADVLRAAHETVDQDVTDDASMVEIAGGLVGTFEGSPDNIKITTQSDIAVAEAIAGGDAAAREFRHGIGFDGHRLVAGGPLRLGGVEIAFDRRLAGHSDGDVLLHAVASALLGAAGLGDLGGNFPSDDPRLADADSARFIAEAVRRAASDGWRLDHIDATVIAQRPRLAVHVPAFEAAIAEAAGTSASRVNVKVTSTDRVGAIGDGDGIAAQAVATLSRGVGAEQRK